MKNKMSSILLLFVAIIFVIMIAAFIRSKKRISEKKEIVIGFAGDTMLGRLVNTYIEQMSYTYPWGNVLPILKKNDINIINLETTLTKSDTKIPKVFNFKATPEKVKALQEANIHIVNLANNHILDFDIEGLIETIHTLDNAKIKHVGAGINRQAAKKPVIIEKHGIKIGIIGYTDYPSEWQATENKPGTNFITIGDIEKIKQDIKHIKEKTDFLIVSIHWGPNMRQKPSKAFIDFAHQMIDAGVDIIHGHSAHIFQGIEIYKNKLIMYDTGDFVDDYHIDPILRNDQSFLYLVMLNKTGIKKIKLIPLIIDNMQVNRAKGPNKKEIINKIKQLSQEFGTKIKNNTIRVPREP